MIQKKIQTFNRSLSMKTVISFFFVALVGAFPIFIGALIHLKNIQKSSFLFIFFMFFLWFLFLILLKISSKTINKVVVFSTGISSFNRKLSKRVFLNFEEIVSVRVEDYMLGEKYIVMKSNEKEEIMIPYALTNWDEFTQAIRKWSTGNPIVYSGLLKSTGASSDRVASSA